MKIEEYIKSRKNDLDIDTPPDEVWGAIKQDWKPNQKRTFSTWKVAASILLMCTIGLLLYTNSLHAEVDRLSSLGDISKEYKQLEEGYQSQIKVLEASLPLDKIATSADFSWLLEELDTLEEINKMYQKDLTAGVAKEQLVGVLIDYYEKRLKLLKKIDLELNRSEKKRSSSRQKEIQI